MTMEADGNGDIASKTPVVTSQGAAAPNCDATMTSPADGATAVAIETAVNWSAASGFPTGYTISIGTTAGGTDVVNAADVGALLTFTPATVLAYATEYFVTITPYNDAGSATGCTSASFTTEDDPNVTVDCTAGPVNTVFCYESGTTTVYSYSSADGSPLSLTINSGGIENNWDNLIILDSDGTELYNGYGNGGDLAGLSFQSSGSSINHSGRCRRICQLCD